jgi:hypothetical protein
VPVAQCAVPAPATEWHLKGGGSRRAVDVRRCYTGRVIRVAFAALGLLAIVLLVAELAR